MKMLTKKFLRRKYIDLRKKLPPKVVSLKSKEITKRLFTNSGFADKNYILAYLPVNNEVETRHIITYLFKNKKKVFVPCLRTSDHTYHFCQLTSFKNLEFGPYKILQPKNHRIIDARQLEAAILPGVAFDKKGVRLGYGKGVYDKLLANFRGLKIGLAYDFQVVDRLPREKHDLVMDIIVSEKRMLEIT